MFGECSDVDSGQIVDLTRGFDFRRPADREYSEAFLEKRPRLVMMCFEPPVGLDDDTPIELHYRWIHHIATRQYDNGSGFTVSKNGGVGAWGGDHMSSLLH